MRRLQLLLLTLQTSTAYTCEGCTRCGKQYFNNRFYPLPCDSFTTTHAPHRTTAVWTYDLNSRNICSCRTTTVGQLIGAYVTLAIMLTLGSPLLAMLYVYQKVMKRKINKLFLHKYTNTVVSITWQLHNSALRYVFGPGC